MGFTKRIVSALEQVSVTVLHGKQSPMLRPTAGQISFDGEMSIDDTPAYMYRSDPATTLTVPAGRYGSMTPLLGHGWLQLSIALFV